MTTSRWDSTASGRPRTWNIRELPALAAKLLRVLEAEEAELAAALEQLARKLACLLPLVHVGRDLAADEAAHGLPQLLVLVRERRQYRALPRVLDHAHRVV